MTCLRSSRRIHFSTAKSPTPTLHTLARKTAARVVMCAALFAALPCLAQDLMAQDPQQPPAATEPIGQPSQSQVESRNMTVTIPAGTHLALLLTHPIQSRYIHRGDDIYAQINAPVSSGNETVIPAGTFVQGTVDKLERQGDRGELRLQSMAITFPDGYVVTIPGPMTLVTDEGYAFKDPGKGRITAAFVLPVAGLGLGALIGHAAGNTGPQTLTASIPPGCVGPPPGCISSSTTAPGNAIKGTAIGSMVGLAAGGIGSLALLLNSHHFYVDAGAPAEMRLPQAITLQQNEMSETVKESADQAAAGQPPAPHPVPPANHRTCWTAGSPGTPSTTIPGMSGPDGIPGPPIIVPGTPPTPGTPYPCP